MRNRQAEARKKHIRPVSCGVIPERFGCHWLYAAWRWLSSKNDRPIWQVAPLRPAIASGLWCFWAEPEMRRLQHGSH